MNALPFDELLDVPGRNAPPPWEELERIDETIRQAAVYLQRSPWLLSRFLPSLGDLARTRSERIRSWLSPLESHPVDELRAFFDRREPVPAAGPSVPQEPDFLPAEDAPPEVTAPAVDTPSVEVPEALAEPSEDECTALPVAPAAPCTEEGEPPVALQPFQEQVSPISLVQPPPPVVTQERIRDFTHQFGKRQRLTSDLVHQRDPALCRRENLVRGLLEQLGEPPETMTLGMAADWKKRLEAVSSPVTMQSWSILDNALKVDLLTMLVALARAVQDAGGPMHEPRQVFSRLSAYSEVERPGHTHGMARQHKPLHGGWLKDARKARESLLKWLGDTTATAAPAASPSRPAAPPLAKTQSESPQDPGNEEEHPSLMLEEDWPWWSDVRNRRAILVGGVPKEPSRKRMEQAFQFAELAWVDGDVRKVNSVTERIQHGGLDLVLIVRGFISHKVAKKVQFACKNYKVPCVFIERGHGVVAVRCSIERYLAQSA